jgi:hypothetical protein
MPCDFMQVFLGSAMGKHRECLFSYRIFCSNKYTVSLYSYGILETF